MSYSRIIVASFLTIILSALSVNAQTNPTQSCQTLTGMTGLNASLFVGHWYEEYRAPASNVSCVFVDVSVGNNNTLNVSTIYSKSKSGFLMNQFTSAVINMNDINISSVFNLTNNNTNTKTTYKILNTDYTSFVVLCGYTNASDSSTSFGVLATRNQTVNNTWLMQLKGNASQILPVFNSSLAGNITQSKLCKTNSAVTSVPAFATLFAAFYALLKLAY